MSAFADHRGARWPVLVAAVFIFATAVAGTPSPAYAREFGCPVDSALVLVGLAGGAQYVDSPDWDDPGRDLGTRARFAFDLGVLFRRWFEPHVEVAFAYLGGSDSLDAALAARGSPGASVGTLVQLQAGARLRWARCGRLQPFASARAGLSRTRLAAPDEPSFTETDAIWSGGAGCELWLHRRFCLRAEGAYIGQAAPDRTRSHFMGQAAVVYAFSRAIRSP